MFRFTESIPIHASPATVWATLLDIESWWPPSNPGHIGIDVRSSGKPVGLGTAIAFEEKVAGIAAHAEGTITRWAPEKEAEWRGVAVYRYYGIPIRIPEGVTWSIAHRDGGSVLSATVWAEFPANLFGRLFEWYAIRILNIVPRDRDHARCELQYLKRILEKKS
jgi:hypothetical protein